MTEPIIVINGTACPIAGEDRETLGDFLRAQGVNSVHLGCEHGVCGACNVLLDGACSRSCLMLAKACAGAEVRTIDGLHDELADALRDAFNRHHALQCGYCTPGVFAAAYELLCEGNALNETAVRERLAGSICRCTGYQGMVEAVLDVAARHAEPCPANVASID